MPLSTPSAADLMLPLPSLTLNDQGRAYLHPALVEQLHLAGGQPANVVPPSAGSDYWHLDLRPEAERFINPGNGRNLRLNGIRLPFGLLNPDKPLLLYLLPGEPMQPAYYPLLPAAAFAQAYTAFLAQAAQAARQSQTQLNTATLLADTNAFPT
jgi:hypothetical protein